MRKNTLFTIALASALVFLGQRSSLGQSVTAPSNTNPTVSDKDRESFEKEANTEIKDWEEKVIQLKAEMKKNHRSREHHRHLRRAIRHIESDIKDVKHELSKLKGASQSDFKHYEDQIRSEFEDMKMSYNKVVNE